jgi:hypothetical protein
VEAFASETPPSTIDGYEISTCSIIINSKMTDGSVKIKGMILGIALDGNTKIPIWFACHI